MFVDSHCHLTFTQFDEDRGEVIERAVKSDVLIVNSIVSPLEVDDGLKFLRDFDNVYSTLGLSASCLDDGEVEETINLIRQMREEIVGLGEVGLDYYWVKGEGERAVLKENFGKFIELSKEVDLPLVVHSRDAEADCIKMLEKHDKPALMHCFSGRLEQALNAIELGCLISIPTNVVYVKKRQELAGEIPVESLVLETDAPYLSPTPKTRNEPINVVKAAQKIAEIKGISVEEVEDSTTENAKKFFRI